MIEVKRKGKAEPDGGTDETPLEQLTKYITIERAREQRFLDEDDNRDLPWVGILTDSQVWHIWEFTTTGIQPVIDWRGRQLDSTNINQLQSLFYRTVGKEWAPADPTEKFKNSLESLAILYETKHDERDTITQQELWLRQLKMSGTTPTAEHQNKLFILHTLLTVVSVKITEMYGGMDRRYGFASWVKNTEWLNELVRIIQRYNWRQQTGDVLRAMYMGLVDKKDRHVYGEYYTPDWLAEKLCSEVIDDEYLECLVNGKDVGGVMDPACGSGTFLYHAVRRIVESKVVQDATLDNHTLTDIIIRVIHGIDIHPVAVAMAKANILRALPDKPSEPLRIYQGDSLQVTRATDEAQLRLDEPGQAFTISSRRGVVMRFPLEFIKLQDFDKRMYRFAQAAVQRNRFPPGLDAGVIDDVKPMLHKAFDTLTEVCYNEGNDIWAWYVIQQVSLYKLKNKISRIVANPPWVRASTIQDAQRKVEVETLADDLNLWVGGKNATGFNIASLFVVQCLKLYGMDGVKSGWVLPDAAMKGGNWAKYVEKDKPSVVWDLGKLPFPKHSNACVNMFGVPEREPQRIVLNEAEAAPKQREGWDVVSERVQFIPIDDVKPITRSAWCDGNRAMARNGATIFPVCLVVLKKYHKDMNGMVSGTTEKSTKGKWRGMYLTVNDIPESYIRKVLYSEGLLPYRQGEAREVILPIDGKGKFLPEKDHTQWWKDASDKWVANRSLKAPETLEKRLDFGGGLRNQLPISKNTVIYNKSGSDIYAARLTTKTLIFNTLYRVDTKSKDEALFLVGILNANIMQDWFKATKKSRRHFDTHFWYEIPIPRFNKKDKNHKKLTKLVKRAEKVAAGVENPNRGRIRKALRDDGIAGELDGVVSDIMGLNTDQN